MKVIAVMLVLGISTAMVSCQPFTVNGTFNERLGEAAQRRQLKYEGFVFDFRSANATDGGTPNAHLKSNQVSQNPFQSTLPGDGNGQTLVTLGPCSGNTVHTHPRGSEISFVTYGEIVFGMVEENTPKLGNELVNRNVRAGQTIHIPQGLQHFSHNPTCLGAQFLANFATADPGTQTVWNSFVQVPTAILHMSTGIPEAQLKNLTSMPLVVAPGTGGEECLKRCGLDFQTANKFED